MILGVTPARGGSKGIPRKNLAVVAGKPLIGHTIEVALAISEIDLFIVSTDDEEIAAVAKSFGVDVPFMRPSCLAADSAAMLPVLKHALLEVEKTSQDKVDTLVLLDPTAPLRTAEDIKGAIHLYRNSDCDAVISASPSLKNPYFNMLRARGDYCELVIPHDPPITRRQDAPEVFDMNTVVAVFSRDSVLDSEQRVPKRTKIFEVPRRRALDLDSPEDLHLLEYFLSTPLQSRGD
jgi:CMP-N-acetylneuraminic acid synthetase